MTDFAFSDRALSRRLERAEAEANARFVEARARAFPESGAQWIALAGVYAMFDGVSSPCTQTFGLGLFDPITHLELEKLEAFFRERGAPVFHEVSPLADLELLPLLHERGYRPIELTSVVYRPLDGESAERDTAVTVRLAREGEHMAWAETAARGWSTENAAPDDFMRDLGCIQAQRRGGVSFFAELEGRPIAAAALSLHEGVALLAGSSTIPEGRRRGAQLALLDARLRYAREQGCDIAMMGALPGSGSQRNAERNGFRIAYTRIKWAGPEAQPAAG